MDLIEILASYPLWLLQIAGTLITGLVIAVVTAIITVRLALHRFRKERWWEKKFDTYSEIFESLHKSKSIMRTASSHILGEIQLSEEQIAALTREQFQMREDFFRHEDISSFLISKTAQIEMENLVVAWRKVENMDEILDKLDATHLLISNFIVDFRKIARKDLKM